MPKTSPNLIAFRQQIDSIDSQIIALLKQRMQVVHQVGIYKRENYPGKCPIRPAREAEMLHRIAREFEGTAFSPASACQIWRTLIGASTAIESDLNISVFTGEKSNDLYWLAHEYFGPSASYNKHLHVNRVIGDVMAGTASIGIIPTFSEQDGSHWWTNLVQPSKDAPRIFAHLPFAYNEATLKNMPTAIAFARLNPEPSGDDVSFYALEVDQNVSQNKLQSVFAEEKLEATWLDITSLNPTTRLHLVEIKGFHDGIESVATSLGTLLTELYFLGAYACPFSLTQI